MTMFLLIKQFYSMGMFPKYAIPVWVSPLLKKVVCTLKNKRQMLLFVQQHHNQECKLGVQCVYEAGNIGKSHRYWLYSRLSGGFLFFFLAGGGSLHLSLKHGNLRAI